MLRTYFRATKRIIALVLLVVIILSMFPATAIAVTPSTIQIELNSTKFVIGSPMEFAVNITANDENETLVYGALNITELASESQENSDAPADSELPYTIAYRMDGDEAWQETAGAFGAVDGFQMQDQKIYFRVMFLREGSFEISAKLTAVESSECLCSDVKNVTASRLSMTLSTNAGTMQFLPKQPTEFTISMTANDDAGKLVTLPIVFNDEAEVILECLDENRNWQPYDAAKVYTVADSTITFRAAFAQSGTAVLTVKAVAEDDGTELCNQSENLNILETVSVEPMPGKNGSITLNGTDNQSIEVIKGSAVEITIKPDNGYIIYAVTVNGIRRPVDSTQTMTLHLNPTENTTISASFKRLYTVTVHYDSSSGSVEINNNAVSNGGMVTVVKGTTSTLVATPKDNYRVVAVEFTTNGTTQKDTTVTGENDYKYSYDLGNLSDDCNIAISFALNEYSVTVKENEENGHFKATLSSSSVNHGDAAAVRITPDKNWQVTDVEINDVPYSNYPGASLSIKGDEVTINIETVEKNINISVTLQEKPSVDFSKISMGQSGFVCYYKDTETDTDIYFYSHGARVTLRPAEEYQYICIDGAKGENRTSFTTTESIIIHSIEVGNAPSNLGGWTEVELPSGGLKIIIDKQEPTIDVKLPEVPESGYYNGDVTVGLGVTEQGESVGDTPGYSGIKEISYLVSCNDIITENGVLAQYEFTRTEKAEAEVTIHADQSFGDDIVLSIIVTDYAGNRGIFESAPLKINAKAPTVSVEFDLNNEDEENVLYKDDRTARVTFEDRAFAFNQDKAAESICITAHDVNGNDVEKPSISWEDDEDSHTATIVFEEDAFYELSVEGYVNDSGLPLEKGFSSGEFIVDQNSPTGTIHIDNEYSWAELLETITFGIWKNTDIVVTAEAEDIISDNVKICYLLSNEQLSREQLLSAYKDGQFVKLLDSISKDGSYVVYAAFEDDAGHLAFVSTDGIVYDNADSILQVSVEDEPISRIFTSDVTIDVCVMEQGDSGIAEVTYQIGEEQAKSLYSYDNTTEPSKSFEGSFVVTANDHNADALPVSVSTTDNAGNVTTETLELNINTCPPKVSVEFNNHHAAVSEWNNIGYYNQSRTATLTVMDRDTAFDAEAAANGLQVDVWDQQGNPVTPVYSLSEWSTDIENSDKHTLTITFNGDGVYSWRYSYTNRADLVSESSIDAGESDYPFAFVIDSGAPTVEILMLGNIWSELLEVLTFGLWENTEVPVSALAMDTISPIRSLEYYVDPDATAALAPEELEARYQAGQFVSDAPTVAPNLRTVIYARAMDQAGNVSYASTGGLILDNKEPGIEISPEEANPFGYYNQDVNISATITDKKISSGIRSIRYEVKNGDNITQEGTLFTDEETALSYDELTHEKEIGFTVSADENNADGIEVSVIAVDHAGNEQTEQVTLNINKTAPTVEITFEDEPTSVVNDSYYYNFARTATITVDDRDSTFHEDNATAGFHVEAYDAAGAAISNLNYRFSGWTHYGSTHTATYTFLTEGNYRWSYSYTNKAGLNVSTGQAEDEATDSRFTFTYDKTAPSAKLTVGKNAWEKLLKILTFGIYSKDTYKVSATSGDLTSPNHMEYYIRELTGNKTLLTEQELEEIYNAGESFKSYTGSFEIEKEAWDDMAFVIYLRVTDDAKNYTYVSSDGLILDSEAPSIVILPDKANTHGYYNKDVDISAIITDAGISSGIQSIRYEVKNGDEITQKVTLFTDEKTAPSYDELTPQKEIDFTVSADENNADGIVVSVIAVDHAGNEQTEQVILNINETAPTVDIVFDDEPTNVVNDSYYYNFVRTATITVDDRASTFHEDNATAGFHVEAYDVTGAAISSPVYALGEWKHDGRKHTVRCTFSTEGNYQWSFSYTNKADLNVSVGQAEDGVTDSRFTFTYDETSPSATLTVGTNSWKELLKILTFGIYSNDTYTVSAASEDVTSPNHMEYYIQEQTEDKTLLTEQALDEIYNAGKSFKSYTEPFEIDRKAWNDMAFVIYLRVTDNAKNYVYISSDGHILDTKPCDIVMTAPEGNENGLYNRDSDVKVKVEVTEPGAYSGIKEIEYWIERIIDENSEETARESVSVEHTANPSYDDLVKEQEFTIEVDKEENNACQVVVHVSAVDHAGNESQQSLVLDIDNTAPTVDIRFDGEQNENAMDGYFASREATITITERSHHFDADQATEGIKLTATDVNGGKLKDENGNELVPFTIGEWTTTEDAKNPDNAKHTAVITFAENANYTLDYSYTDHAGNVCNPIEAMKFTVDNEKPSGKVTVKFDVNPDTKPDGTRTVTWEKLADELHFGFWGKYSVDISAAAEDAISPIAAVDYYAVVAKNASDGTKVLDESALDAIDAKEWQSFDPMRIAENKQLTLYLRITDYAGNYTYISTEGLIVDHEAPNTEALAPNIAISPMPAHEIYNSDVTLDVTVRDPEVGGTYSGLKLVTYRILKDGEKTQEGTLFMSDVDHNDSRLMQEQLISNISKQIKVDSKKNNSNDVAVIVYAEDNVGNGAEAEIKLKIDITPPTIDVSYDNNAADNGKYFRANRTATIAVTERNFNPDDVILNVTGTAGTPGISGWHSTGSGDSTRWTATMTFAQDADYTFNVDYTDLAMNHCSNVDYRSSVAPQEFTIDKTLPVITVTYDNNKAQNGSYYDAPRTATISIREHNFSTDRFKVALSASRDGAVVAAPAIGGWSNNGDVHTATIRYSADAHYVFDVEYTDMAGNAATDFTQQNFTIDQTAPSLEITGVANRSANNGKVIPVVTYSDFNFSLQQVEITLVGANRGKVKLLGNYNNIHNGQVFTFDDFARKQEIDDIYTLTARLTDLAGNSTEKTIVFSVNRFGSTYQISPETEALNGSYVQRAEDITITEINPNELNNIRVIMFKNNETVELVRGTDYDIEIHGGNKDWYEYIYHVYASNFSDDGVYRLSFYSEDSAGNAAENTLDTKNTAIRFGIDATSPTVVVMNLESGKTYATENLTVQMLISDNLLLDSLTVYLDDFDKPFAQWDYEQIDEILNGSNEFTFDVSGGSTKAHAVRIVCVDAAGNETIEEITDFYVTTNLFVRFFTNKPLFFGSIVGVIALSCFYIFLILKRKKEEESEAALVQ